MKKLSRILCKLLGCSCALNFMPEVSNVKITAMDNKDNKIEQDVPKQEQSDDITRELDRMYQSVESSKLKYVGPVEIVMPSISDFFGGGKPQSKNVYYTHLPFSVALELYYCDGKPMFPGTDKPMFPNEPQGLTHDQRAEYRMRVTVKREIMRILAEADKRLDLYTYHKDYINKANKDTFKAKLDELMTMSMLPDPDISLVKKLENELNSINCKILEGIVYKRLIDDCCVDSMSFLENYRDLIGRDNSTKIEEKYIDRAICLIYKGKGEEAKELMKKCRNKVKKMLKKCLINRLKEAIPSFDVGISEYDKKVLNKYIDEITEAMYSSEVGRLKFLKKGLKYKCGELKRRFSQALSKLSKLKLSNKTGTI